MRVRPFTEGKGRSAVGVGVEDWDPTRSHWLVWVPAGAQPGCVVYHRQVIAASSDQWRVSRGWGRRLRHAVSCSVAAPCAEEDGVLTTQEGRVRHTRRVLAQEDAMARSAEGCNSRGCHSHPMFYILAQFRVYPLRTHGFVPCAKRSAGWPPQVVAAPGALFRDVRVASMTAHWHPSQAPQLRPIVPRRYPLAPFFPLSSPSVIAAMRPLFSDRPSLGT